MRREIVPKKMNKNALSSAYIHVPFCLSKCRYCGFNSAPSPGTEEIERYCRALEKEIRDPESEIRDLETVYFGGGTPTVLSAGQMEYLISALAKRASFDRGAEATIEANPETVDLEKLRTLRALGFNRLSLGVQSFDDNALRFLGRAHDSRRAMEAFEQARRAGFDNIGTDLIHGIPGQSLAQWENDIRKTTDLCPEHVSAYSLTFEPGTEFSARRAAGAISPCDEDLEADMFLTAREMLAGAGYEHYEVSNYAKPGFRSRHNLNYWHCGDYLGFGAGAHSHLGGRRWANAEPYAEYSDKIEKGGKAIAFVETLTREQRLFEAVFLGLRMPEGIDAIEFRSSWGLGPLAYKPEAWNSLASEGLLLVEQGNPRLTDKGMLIADSCLARFAP
jgi:oxygen-independent coproporphyrinogen-3 oxidase